MLTAAIDLLRKELASIEEELVEQKYKLDELDDERASKEVDYLAAVSAHDEIERAIDCLVKAGA